jgi:hypothetical protein
MFAVFIWSFAASFTTALAARTQMSIQRAQRDAAQGRKRAQKQEAALDFMLRNQK